MTRWITINETINEVLNTNRIVQTDKRKMSVNVLKLICFLLEILNIDFVIKQRNSLRSSACYTLDTKNDFFHKENQYAGFSRDRLYIKFTCSWNLTSKVVIFHLRPTDSWSYIILFTPNFTASFYQYLAIFGLPLFAFTPQTHCLEM